MSDSSRRPAGRTLTAMVGIAVAAQMVLLPLGGTTAWMTNASAASQQATLKIGMTSEVRSLNPYNALEDAEYVVFNLIYDRLFSYDEDLNIVPLLVTSWEVDTWDDADDPETPGVNEGENRLWRYHIVQDVMWHDGEPLTTADVAFSINVNINETMWAFTPYVSVRTAEFARAINDTTVEVYLKIPSVLANNLAVPVVPEHIWSRYTPGEIQYSVTNDFPIGSGPFKFVEFIRGQYVMLERNPFYHLGPVSYDRLIFLFYGSDQVMAEDLRNGNIDCARFPPLTYNFLKGSSGIYTAEVKRNYQITVGFNNWRDPASKGHPLLLDDNVRRAMHLAIDKQYLIDTVWGGYGDMGYALPAPVMPYWHWQPTQEQALDYDPARANAMLDAAGYDAYNAEGVRVVNRPDMLAPMGTPLSFKFQVRNDAPEDLAAAPYIREMWGEIGVKVTIETVEEGTLETDVYWSASHQVYMWYWSGDFDPNYLLGVMTTDQIKGWNDPYFSNETYDQLFLLQMTQSGDERRETAHEMQRIWYELSGMIVLTYPYALYAWTEQHFTNWGDPEEHPARIIDHYWSAAPLYLELEPVEGDGIVVGLSTAMMVAIGAVVAVVIIAAVAVMRRRGGGEGALKESESEKGRGLD